MPVHPTARHVPLLNTDQLLQQAEQLARSHRICARRHDDRLLARLTDNDRVLTQTCRLLSDAEQAGRRLTPAGTWLLDNIYLIDEHVAIARRHLPAGYSRQLPQLASASSAGLPRVYDIVLNAIAHGDGRVDADVLGRYVAAYQNVSPLALGELWAIPIMLRLALIDNLQRIARRVTDDRLDRNRADAWADTLTEVAASDPKSLVLAVADLARSAPPATSSFVAELARRLQGHGSALAMPLTWIEQWLSDIDATIEDMVQAESQQQAADQVAVSNSIASLRLLSKVDWREFVESVSVVERDLCGDPSGVYTEMDFATRDRYRHVVEQLARRSGSTEQAVAMEAVALAAQAAADRRCDRVEAHVGYYLIDDGRAALDRALGIGGLARWVRTDRRSRLLLYTVAYAVIVAAGSWTLLARSWGEWRPGWRWLVAGLAAIAFSELAVALVNRAATHVTDPRPLPRLDLSRGIGVRRRTMVVVPTMLTSADTVRELAEALEVCFLANRDDDIYFALLTDFVDAETETTPDDLGLLDAATREITKLNARYGFGPTDRFFLLHRPRLWNPSEAAWMASERKRGKLAALNALLQTGDQAAFMRIVGKTESLGVVRYVITLDAGSQLPRDGARALVGTLAHPLNHARFDDARRIVTAGYGILHPRVTTLMSGQRRSRYAGLYGGETGIDPYTRAVSDVYQDLFGEGSFVGKGIYDVDAFERALAGRVPDNRVLSHDLLEGCYARAGLVSDVQLYEHHPQTYAADVARRYRWIRGDWQLLPWLMPLVARRRTRSEPNPLSLLSLGKLIDNLRRSLFAAATTALFIIGWTTRRGAVTWTLGLAAIVVLPPLVSSAIALRRHRGEMSAQATLRESLTTIRRNVTPAVLTLICLPYEAYYSVDAIVRTLWRMAVSHRHLLQWRASSDVERSLSGGLGASLRAMWFAPALAGTTAAVVMAVQPTALWVASPLLLAWAGSPLVMWWLGQPRTYRRVVLGDDELVFLRRLARRTWAFFETYVTAADHWLPPDNVQMEPTVVVARRTSPTNIGLSLLADVAAYDFGYLPASAMSVRVAHTLETVASLPRHRGHFYNWYDTATAQPLPPHYVSTVDSGNLCGHLLTLRQALLALPDAPVLSPRAFHGLTDTVAVLNETNGTSSPACSTFEQRLHTVCHDPPASLADARDVIDELCAMADAIVSSAPVNTEAAGWADALVHQCVTLRDDLADVASGWPEPHIPTLSELASHPHVEPSTAHRARESIGEFERLADVAAQCAQPDWRFLYDERQRLLSIGYHIDDDRLDDGVYDLLASEARLATFVAIAQGHIPEESWFALGRLLTDLGGDTTLLSWSGSMFEYLMPLLVMPNYPNTLLDETAHHCVERQIAYGRAKQVPWGISESAYNTVDADGNYQYRAFGVPELGLQRQARHDLVISPYATMLALMVQPDAACRNLQRMTDAGFAGRFGMFEAVDYTAQRLPPGKDHAVIASYMVHHQAMGLLALDHLLADQPMQARFAGDPALQATMLLLQERVPQTGVLRVNPSATPPTTLRTSDDTDDAGRLRVFPTPASARPAVQLLSNGRYHVMVTNAGGGYSRRGDLAVTRWRQDGTSDDSGIFCYLRDTDSGDIWSTTYQPTAVPVDDYQAIFSDAKAEFRGTRLGLSTHIEIAVSPEDDIELRRLRVTNRTREPRTVDVVTYAEVVLAPPVSDELHPAYSKLFVQTELVPSQQAIVCARRSGSLDESTPWMFHLVAVHDADVDHISYETDRSRFIGRGNTLTRPDGATQPGPLSNTAGSVLDPVVAIRCTITLPPGTTATIDMVVGVGTDRGGCDELIAKYRDRRLADRVFELAWTHSQVVSRQISVSPADSQLYERMAGLIIHPHRALRVGTPVLQQNQRGQSGLWGQSISGDHPIALVRITDAANVELVRQMVQCHAYLRLKGVIVDLVIWNDEQGGYRQELHDLILGLIAAGRHESLVDRPGGIFLRPSQQLSPEDRILLQSVAHVVVSDDQGSLAEQVSRRPPRFPTVPKFISTRPYTPTEPASSLEPEAAASGLSAHNGLGGFTADGREYIIDLAVGQTTPAPWSNVIANATFGCVVSDSTPGYTWADNAHEFRLTPWHNDPVTDASGEAFYLRDDETGHIWSPMPSPRRGTTPYRIRHGFGYSVYEHVEDGIASELWIYVDPVDPIKYSVLKLRNLSGVHRRLSATGYVEWILGDLHANTEMHVTTALDPIADLITAQNRYKADFADRVAFFDVDPTTRHQPARFSYTGDRTEFLGRNGNQHDPAGLRNARLSGRLGPALDPCTAIQVLVELDADQHLDVVFRLGVGANLDDARDVAGRSRGTATAQRALEAVHDHWRRTLDTVRVTTPEPAIDVMANGWLLYQTIACRYLARSGYYQSGGAFGFRDQLQDTMAMLHAEPDVAREHLLLCASRQFLDGDVQHWWHPPTGRGIRTRCSDDYLWLPFAAVRYVDVTGDHTVLDEVVTYLDGRQLNDDEESYFDLPGRADVDETLYQHCVRALRRGMRLLGERGLPLMGSGDWNDGMNRVGKDGRGESVWLGFFLYDTLVRFEALTRSRSDDGLAQECTDAATQLRINLDEHAWDGGWYRRAWFDDGTPLGSAGNPACAIDSIAQSWSVLSGAADPLRAAASMAALDQHLVRRDAGLIQLLDPPFDSTAHDPGYIRGYVPGVRENGGQYTHAAVWAIMAFARLGHADTAWDLLKMINPVELGRADNIGTYKVEPYVLAADVYAVEPHVGRGGWTWYTGSAGWMYRLIIESLLGLQRHGDILTLAPCIPSHWPLYEVSYRYGDTTYHIRIQRSPDETARLTIDGIEADGWDIRLHDDHVDHVVDGWIAS